jgi:hypothetical protein
MLLFVAIQTRMYHKFKRETQTAVTHLVLHIVKNKSDITQNLWFLIHAYISLTLFPEMAANAHVLPIN